MKTTVNTEVMTFDELSDEAKEKARAWYREHQCDDFEINWQDVREDAKMVGLNIKSLGNRRRDSQGDFVGDALDTAKKIMQEHGKGCDTFKLADAYTTKVEELDKKFPLYGQDDSPYDFECEEEKVGLDDDFLGDLLGAYYDMLVKANEDVQGDQHVDESIQVNEYTFTAEGERF